MNLENEILKIIHRQKLPDLVISKLCTELDLSRELISKTLVELKKSGGIFYIIKSPDVVHVTHINGTEIEWKEDGVDEIGNGLFDREGNIFINPNEFFDYISTLPASSKYENEILFKELEELSGDQYDAKVLEIATKNIKLIRRITFGVIENETLTEEEIREYYSFVLKGLCRSIEKFDYKKGFTLSTLANQWILQGSTRARSKIIQKRMMEKYGIHAALHSIDNRSRDIKNSSDKYPNFTELQNSFDEELKDKAKLENQKKVKRAEAIESKRGINKLFNLLFHEQDNDYSQPVGRSRSLMEAMGKSKQFLDGKDKIFNSLKLLNEKEKEIIIFRYGLYSFIGDYNITLDNFYEFENKFVYIEETGMTLEEIGELYGHTRERVRQIEKVALAKLKFYVSTNSPNQQIPEDFFPKTFTKFFKINNLHTIEDITSLTVNKLADLKNATSSKVNTIVSTFKMLGFELKHEQINEGDIDFSHLSVRSTTALKRFGITTKKQLIDADIEHMPGIGAKSINELYDYLAKDPIQKTQLKKYSNIHTALMFPCANTVSQQNFHKTMSKKISLHEISNYLLPNQKKDLTAINNEFYFWGIKSTTDKGWDNIDTDAAGLFFANKEAFAAGTIVYKFINRQLADFFWAPEKDTNRSYKYMFAFSTIEKTSIPQIEINQAIGFKENYVTQGFMGLNKVRSKEIVSLLNTYKN